jgi:hypothetical protein
MSAEELPFELHITGRMRSLWEELGVDEESRFAELDELKSQFRLLYLDLIDRLSITCHNNRQEIERLQSTQRQAMKAFGLTEAEIEAGLPSALHPGSLLLQLEMAKQSYETFRALSAERLQKFENLIRITNDLFDRLGVPPEERGEFGELGDTDLSRDRIERFKAKIQDLRKEIDIRAQECESAKAQIQGLLTDLRTPLSREQEAVFQSTAIDLHSVSELYRLRESLGSVKQERMAQLTQYAIEITHLWDLLAIEDAHRVEFLSSHSTIGEGDLAACAAEIARLSALRNERLPSLISAQKAEAEALWERLHIAPESRPIFEAEMGDESQIESVQKFAFYEREIVRLKKLMLTLQPLLSAIEEREEIIHEYESVCQATTDAQRLLSRERGCAHQLLREEKARRRYRGTLPKLEKKLAQMLSEFKSVHGTDFEWDGAPYIERLADSGAGIQKSRSTAAVGVPACPRGLTFVGSPRKLLQAENSADQGLSLRGRTVKS